MRVTEVKVFPVTDDKLKAFVSVVLDNCFMVNDIKVIEGRDGRFISMPSRRKRNGKFKDIAHPLNSDTRQMLEREILDEYERLLNGDGTPAPRKSRSRRERRPRRSSEDSKETRPTPDSGARDGDGRPARREAVEESEQTGAQETPQTPPTSSEKTLEEVTEKHLSDSFWTS